ncbi:GSCOCT00013820001.3-RA-CDS, partial [Cotesia congregata]
MNVFDEAFWRSTKMHLVASGAWPFQRPLYSILLRCMVFSFVESIMILEIIRLFYVAGDLMMTLTVIPVILYVAVIQVSVTSNHTKRLLLIVKNCWESDLLDKGEIELLRSDGRKHGDAMYTYYLLYYSQPAVYALTTLAPIILDITSPLNGTRERFFVFAEIYGVDAQEYAFYIHIHHFAALSVFTWAFVAFKANYCTLIQHACSMFTIIGRRVRILGDGLDVITSNELKLKLIKSISICLKMHQDTLDFVFQLEDNYSTFLLGVLAVNAVGMSTIGFRFITNLDDFEHNVQCLTYLAGQVFYIYYLSTFGQKLIDHSEYVFESICVCKSYNFPQEMKPMVILLMLRSLIPTKLTAGKLFIMSLENFANV